VIYKWLASVIIITVFATYLLAVECKRCE